MSFTLNYTGDEINAILARANNGGEIDDELALKAPLVSPALTGNPTAPTQPEEDSSTKVATTEYADRAADAAEAAAEAAAKEYTDAATSALYITDTASGSIASFSDGADDVAMRSVVVNITPVQSGSGNPSPDNVRPISGWTGAEITRTGKNLLPVTATAQTLNGVTFTPQADGSIKISGTATANTFYYLHNVAGWMDSLIGKGNVILTGSATGVAIRLYHYDGTNTVQSTNGTPSASVPITAAGAQVDVRIASGTTVDTMIYPMLRLASDSDATFEPYAGQTFPVTWESQAGEVFGGTIDVVSGELKVTHKSVTYTGASSESWSYGSNRFRISVPDMVTTISPRVEVLSNIGVYAASGSAVGTIFGSGGDVYYYAPASITTVADYRTWLGSNNLQVMYPLAQPVIYQLMPQQITSLLGSNNVWSNTGDVEVEYVADPKLYIAKMFGGGTLTLGSVSPLSINRPVTISEEDLEQAGEVSEAVEAAAETVLPAESGETEEEAQE